MTALRPLLPVLLLGVLAYWLRLAPDAWLGMKITFGIVLGLVLLSALVSMAVKVLLPGGRLKTGLLRLRRPLS